MVTAATSGSDNRVDAVVRPVVEAAGLHLEEVRLSRAGRRSVVQVVLDLEEHELGSLDSDRLGQVSREISRAMDAADPVRGEYLLEVSTPGTDRPLTEPRHFRRARTRLVRLALRDGGVRVGRLREVDGSVLVLEADQDVVERIPLEDVARGAVEVELTRDPATDDGGTL